MKWKYPRLPFTKLLETLEFTCMFVGTFVLKHSTRAQDLEMVPSTLYPRSCLRYIDLCLLAVIPVINYCVLLSFP